MNEGSIINVEKLTKRFGNFTAVSEISFGVKAGEIFAFLGPNGAGKTTTIKILITLLDPTSGKASIDGCDVIKEAAKVREIIGYVPQMLSVDGSLTAYENLMLMARLYDIPRRLRKARILEVLEFLKLQEFSKVLTKNFSGGMIRKLEIGQAMLHHPKVLFLDEPTVGLDPIAKNNVWEHLLELKNQGTTIFFSSHNMDEVEMAADRLAIMNLGKISAIGGISELKEKAGNKDANLEEVFVFFTGNQLEQKGSLRDINRARQTARRLG